MADMRFADVMQQERERLHKEREEVFNQQHELEGKLADINRELSAIDVYEAAKTGKASTLARKTRGPRRQQARRGSKRDALMEVIKANPSGLTRGEILERMGLKGDKSGEMSISNALTALTKGNQVSRRDGKYVASV
jgi:hypothetical protein